MRIGDYRWNNELALAVLEKVALALVALLVTWLLARAAKWAFAKLVDNVGFLQRSTSSGTSIGEQLGKIVGLLIWGFGLLVILTILGLGNVAGPIDNLLNNVMEFIPRLVGAGLIFFIGLMLARIARDLVVATLQTVDFDKWANRGGVETATGNTTISKTIGTIVYAVIVIFVSILALDALDLESVSGPASDMLRLILDAIPRIIGAALLLALGYLISRFVVQVLKEVLPGLGVDRAMAESEVLPASTRLSDVIARVVQVAIVLFFAIAATRLLGFPELTAILDQVLELGGRVIFGAVVIGVGFVIAGFLVRMIAGTGGQTTLASSIVKWATIVLFTFMGLQFMGVGEEIVQTAFTAAAIGAAVAGALAFGLGGREWAGRKLEQIDRHVENYSPTTVAAPASRRVVDAQGETSATSNPSPMDDPADLPPGS